MKTKIFALSLLLTPAIAWAHWAPRLGEVVPPILFIFVGVPMLIAIAAYVFSHGLMASSEEKRKRSGWKVFLATVLYFLILYISVRLGFGYLREHSARQFQAFIIIVGPIALFTTALYLAKRLR